MPTTIPCTDCNGEGRYIRSRYGGNDPDTWDAGSCEACGGTRNHRCDQCGTNDALHVAMAWKQPHLVCDDCWREELESVAD